MVVNGDWKKMKNPCHVMEQHKISCHGEVRVGRTASRSLLGFTRKSSIDCQVV